MLLILLFYVFTLVKADLKTLTSNAGNPIDVALTSETIGPDGPMLLQDAWFLERLQVHNRERIPERNVHARGATAFGFFMSTADMSNLTMAKVFSGNKKRTPMGCRWSTVIHGRNSPEFLRDPRGFAIKFYTEEGNYDIVGLSFPVFFIRDSIRFPEMIRALKPNPLRGVQEWWRIWDLFSHLPESVHMFSWLMDDVGIPRGYPYLDGWGIHAYKWINKEGHETLIRYYYQSEQGVKSFKNDSEAILQDFSFATADLYDMIAKGEFPMWKVYIQIMDKPREELDFDPLDTTKQWPVDQFPYHEIGELVFNRNPNSQYRENEYIAFSPGRYVPGISGSNDKMLQGRQFAYADTQRYRLGVNNQMLPVNRPKCDYTDRHVDGVMNFKDSMEKEVNYFPSTIEPEYKLAKPFPHDTQFVEGHKTRTNIVQKMSDFHQAGERYRSFDSDRQDRFAMRIASSLSGSRITTALYNVWLGYWKQADPGLAEKIKNFHKQLIDGDKNGYREDVHYFRDGFMRACGARLS